MASSTLYSGWGQFSLGKKWKTGQTVFRWVSKHQPCQHSSCFFSVVELSFGLISYQSDRLTSFADLTCSCLAFFIQLFAAFMVVSKMFDDCMYSFTISRNSNWYTPMFLPNAQLYIYTHQCLHFVLIEFPIPVCQHIFCWHKLAQTGIFLVWFSISLCTHLGWCNPHFCWWYSHSFTTPICCYIVIFKYVSLLCGDWSYLVEYKL